MSVLKKLNQARSEFHASKIKKTGHNKFAGYDYFELGDFIIPALTIFNRLDLSAVISFTPELAVMTVTDLEDGTETKITSPMSSAALKGCHEVQNLGAVQTYLRRYLWVAALEIVEHDALDATTGKDPPEQKIRPFKSAHTATDGAGEGLPAERKAIVEEIALFLIEEHQNGNDLKAAEVWYADDTFDDADERVYCWALLKAHSKLRAFIKDHKPTAKEAA